MKQNKYFLSLMSGVLLLGVACAKDIDKNKIGADKDTKPVDTKNTTDEGNGEANPSANAANLQNPGKKETPNTDKAQKTKKPVIKYKMPIVTNYKLAREIEGLLNGDNAKQLSAVVLDSLRNQLINTNKDESLISDLKCQYKVLNLEHRSVKDSIKFSDREQKRSKKLTSISDRLLVRDRANQNLIDIYLLDNKLDSSIPYKMRLGIECIGGSELVNFKLQSSTEKDDFILVTKNSVKSNEYKGTDITDLDKSDAQAKVNQAYKHAKALLRENYTGYTEFVSFGELSYSQIMSLTKFSGNMEPNRDAAIPSKTAQCEQLDADLEIAEDYEHTQEIARLQVELADCEEALREMKGIDANGNDLLKQYKSKVSVLIEKPTELQSFVQLDWEPVNLFSEKSHREILESEDTNIKLSLEEAKKEQAPPANYKGPEFEEVDFEKGFSFIETLGNLWEKIESIEFKNHNPTSRRVGTRNN